MSVGLYYSPNK